MAIWVQLLAMKHVDNNGTQKRYQPGDWVCIGKQTAMRWVAAGEARIPNAIKNGLLMAGSGIGVWGRPDAQPQLPDIEFTPLPEKLSLPYHLTCLWQPPYKLKTDGLAAGFDLLKVWQVACPLWNYDVLAKDVGSAVAQERTKSVVHDLRIPVYDIRLIFLRRCPETEQLVEQWNEERESGDHDQLTFLRALYIVKPLILALPMTWTQEDLYVK